MKKTLKLMTIALLAFGLFACGEKKITQEDLNAAQATLFNEDHTINEAVAPQVAEKYCQFVEQSPNDTTAAMWLYHAMEINVLLKDADKSIEIGNQLVKQYPQSEWAPMSLFLLGSYVYNDQLNDTAQAHVTFQKLIDDYPESPLVDDAEKSIEYLGLTPEEIMNIIMMSQFVEEEEEL
jgi:outer membrane protein assembly factor BamD (BamD/ComL family)